MCGGQNKSAAVALWHENAMKEYLIISTSVDLVRASADEVVYISADGNYSSIVFTNGVQRVVTLQLGQLEQAIAHQLTEHGRDFIRIGKSLIINRTYISYIHSSRQQLELSDGRSAPYALTASREALKQLKELIEKETT